MLMTIRLNQQELNGAVSMWLSLNGIDLNNKKLEIDLVNGRKGGGDYATVTIRDGAEPIDKEINIGPVTPAVVITKEEEEVAKLVSKPIGSSKKTKQTKLNKSEKLIPELPVEEEAMDAKEEAEILETVSAPPEPKEAPDKEAEVSKTTSLFG